MKLVRAAGSTAPTHPCGCRASSSPTCQPCARTYGYRANEVFLDQRDRRAVRPGRSKGDPRTYADLLTPDGPAPAVADHRRHRPGQGPGHRAHEPTAASARPPGWSVGRTAPDLVVTPYTFRAENTSCRPTTASAPTLPTSGAPSTRTSQFMKAGVDGLFCDQPDICVTARKEFLGQASSPASPAPATNSERQTNARALGRVRESVSRLRRGRARSAAGRSPAPVGPCRCDEQGLVLAELLADLDAGEDLGDQVGAGPAHHGVGVGDDEHLDARARSRSSAEPHRLGAVARVDVAPQVPLAQRRRRRRRTGRRRSPRGP